MPKVYVIGSGSTKYGKFDLKARELMLEASQLALADSGIDAGQIDGAFIGNAFSVAEKQGHLGPLLMTGLGIPEAPATAVEAACASGASAFREAWVNIAAGAADVMLAGGVERVSMLDTLTATSYFAYGSDYAFEGANGCSFPGLYAAMARVHMKTYGTTEEDLAHIAVKNHANGAKNPKAHLPKAITVEDVMKSMVVASPLKLYDACPFSDGAAAVILASEEASKPFKYSRIEILGAGRAGAVAALQERQDLASIPSTKLAYQQALNMAGIEPGAIDLLEVHDCFTIAEAIALEDMGFAPKGKGAKLAREGVTAIDGKLPVNPSGGLKSKGHPVGATGVGQIVELYEQLLGRSGARQVKDARVGLAHNVGATGGSCAVHILGAT
jgi:acetyl-CoA C-acetyltransferase